MKMIKIAVIFLIVNLFILFFSQHSQSENNIVSQDNAETPIEINSVEQNKNVNEMVVEDYLLYAECLSILLQWKAINTPPTVDVTGKWKMIEWDKEEERSEFEIDLQQNGDKFTGYMILEAETTYKFPLEGKVRGNKVLSMTAINMNQRFVNFGGSVEGNKMEGVSISIMPDGARSGAKWVAQKIE